MSFRRGDGHAVRSARVTEVEYGLGLVDSKGPQVVLFGRCQEQISWPVEVA